ncbi:MAG: hypothetical protein GY814_03720, partial [Gammaproteobacteria bacterium]|nr:hypothetical protein [Gammaproteobacteria bacterium]
SGSAGIKLRWKTATFAPEIIPSTVAYPAQFMDGFAQLAKISHRAAKFISGFDISESELDHFIKFSDDFSEIKFDDINASHWIRIRDYIELRNSIPQSQLLLTQLFTYMKSVNPLSEDDQYKEDIQQTLIRKINQATGWDKVSIASLINHFFLLPDDFPDLVKSIANEKILNKFRKIIKVVDKTGLSVSSIEEWGKVETDFNLLHDTAQLLKNTVKAKYDGSAWLEIASGLSDKLRENQKQALIGYLLAQPSIRKEDVIDANGLYEHLLIDVQMGACMNTSRIVQANAAIQLFINRILLNLEPKIPPQTIDKDRWQWMKNYRVWEANRKVFLYPENWLAPEWRTDRSEFFKELESHLLQNDITERSVEQGLRNYLMSMNEVANLDVCGMHQENDDDGKHKCLHVFGRTHNLPYKYYYRRWNVFHKWSAWECVTVDVQGVEGEISGVHLVPVVWKGRLFLFWPEFMEKAKEPDGNSESTITELGGGENGNTTIGELEPTKYWEIRLAWSEYVDGAWGSKQVSKEYIEISNWGSASSLLRSANVRVRPHFDDENSSLVIIVDAYSKEWRSFFVISDIHSPLTVGQCKLNNGDEPIFDEINLFTKEKYQNTMLSFPPDDNIYLKYKKNYNLINENSTTRLTPFIYTEGRNSYFITQYLARQWGNELDKVHNHSDMVTLATDSETTGSGTLGTMLLNRDTDDWHTSNNYPIWVADPVDLEPEFDKVPCVYGQINVIKTHIKDAILTFHTFHHPFSSTFVTQLNLGGIQTLMDSDTIESDDGDNFEGNYDPDFSFVKPNLQNLGNRTYYQENICFDPLGANSLYNWELFFHAPLYIATRLSKNGKYEEAMNWFHYIFDPTTTEKPKIGEQTAHYWKVPPFKIESRESLETFFRDLNRETNPENVEDSIFADNVKEWRVNPFDPHLVASNRPVAYMKHVVIGYIENLVAWGDSLFRQFTRESVYEAIQLYVIASHVLGKRPEFIPKRGAIKKETYVSLRDKLDAFGNALVNLENIFPYTGEITETSVSPGTNLLGIGEALYFCIPANDKLLEHWDTVEDRLFKIRHCQDIEGVERNLALFAPPIDPAALIQARSQGLSLGDVLADLNSPPPIYRFAYLLQKANEFCGDVKALGSAMLSALEKRDGEELGRLRASQETDMLERVTGIRERQVLSAKANIENLLKTRETAQLRLDHYNTQLLGNDAITVPDAPTLDATLNANSQLPKDTSISAIGTEVDMSLVGSDESGVKIIPREDEQLSKNEEVKWINASLSLTETLAGLGYAIPKLQALTAPLGVGGKVDSPEWGAITHMLANAARGVSSFLSAEASQASTMAGYIRRTHDWTLQANLVIREIIQLDKQITSADIQLQVAEKELKNHLQQIENSKQVEQFLKDKFTNQELYQWMKEQLFSVYKQSYNLAFEMAKKAEKAYQYEMGTEATNFLQYGYWDSSKDGLVAGEKLQLGLRQLENEYLNNNRRELELSKSISVALLNPLALIELRETGKGHLSLPEELFDLDFQGHYFRRIKAVSLSIPCVAGPYTTVNCSLRLLKNSFRKNTLMNSEDDYQHNNDMGLPLDDDRFRSSNVPVTSIATSTGQNDAGMFEFNYGDVRYLPFEFAGVISNWMIELTDDVDLRQFDYSTISDVILHLKYTARESSGTFKDKAIDHLHSYMQSEEEGATPSLLMFNLKQDFPTQWHRFLNPTEPAVKNVFDLEMAPNLFPVMYQDKKLEVTSICMLARCKTEDSEYSIVVDPPLGEEKITFTSQDDEYGDLRLATHSTPFPIDPEEPPITWKLEMTSDGNNLQDGEVGDFLLVLEYRWDD